MSEERPTQNNYTYDEIHKCKINNNNPHTWMHIEKKNSTDEDDKVLACYYCLKTYEQHEKEVKEYIEKYKPERSEKTKQEQI